MGSSSGAGTAPNRRVRTLNLEHRDIVSSRLYRRFVISYVLMAIIPLLVFGYFVTTYIQPTVRTKENIVLITTLTVALAVIGFFMMRRVLISFLRLRKYTNEIAAGGLSNISERSKEPELDEMVSALNRIVRQLLMNQDELRRNNEILEQRYSEIERLGKAKDEMVRMLAHDVRNFITIITGYLGLLASGDLDDVPEKKEKFLRQLQATVETLRHLVENMLQIERMEDGRIQLRLEDIDLEWLAEECLRPLRPLLEGEEKRLVHQVDKSPGIVRADRNLLSRVVANLLWNAHQHTRKGVCISLRVGVIPERGRAFLSVSDNGEGISESVRERIFDKFFQGEGTKKGSAGLGLSFCKMAVDLHGGTIDVESKEGHGSTFRVSIPTVPE